MYFKNLFFHIQLGKIKEKHKAEFLNATIS